MLPGQCWAFGGSQGQVSIELAQYITISHVSLGHIPQMLSPDLTVSSAPRTFSVFVSHRFLSTTWLNFCIHIQYVIGKLDMHLFVSQGNQHTEDPVIYLGTFQYDPNGGPLQTFKIAVSPLCHCSHAHPLFFTNFLENNNCRLSPISSCSNDNISKFTILSPF